ncbi:MAG: hypothetical protein EBZ49_13675 [Proteobacteria bacterium]|nr:hypothetical protein [Pseudomonadota bacterium]
MWRFFHFFSHTFNSSFRKSFFKTLIAVISKRLCLPPYSTPLPQSLSTPELWCQLRGQFERDSFWVIPIMRFRA